MNIYIIVYKNRTARELQTLGSASVSTTNTTTTASNTTSVISPIVINGDPYALVDTTGDTVKTALGNSATF